MSRSQVLALLLIAGPAGCGSKGHLEGTAGSPSFVTEDTALYFEGRNGIERVDLDGGNLQTVFATDLRLRRWSPDHATVLLGDEDCNLFVGDVASGAIRAIEPRGCDGTFSADSRQVAIERFDDDAIVVVDVASGERLNLDRLAEHPPETALPPPCDGLQVRSLRWEHRIEMQRGDDPPVVVIEEVGRERGWHDYRDDFDSVQLSPGCGYVVFGFDHDIWVAEAREHGRFAKVADGDFLRFDR
jgi:hypothetical protein